MEEEVTNESIIKDLQSKKIQMKEIKVGDEYQHNFSYNSSEYEATKQQTHTLIITYIRSGVYFYKLKGFEDAGEFHFEQNSYVYVSLSR